MPTLDEIRRLTANSRSVSDKTALQTIQGKPATAGSTL